MLATVWEICKTPEKYAEKLIAVESWPISAASINRSRSPRVCGCHVPAARKIRRAVENLLKRDSFELERAVFAMFPVSLA